MDTLLLIVAILPVIILGVYIYKRDKHKEPTNLLARLFLSGIISCFLVLAISLLLTQIFPFLNKGYNTMNFIEFILYTFIFIALTEECCKWLMTYYLGYKNKEFDEVYDILVYAVFVALGFAAFENILYVFGNDSLQVGLMRAFLAIPGHVCDGIAMGYYLSLARFHEKRNNLQQAKINKLKSILVPTLYHGIYDYCCLTDSNLVLLVFIIFIVFLYTISLKKIKLLSEQTLKLNPNNYCPRCGNKVNGNFCSKCGLKQQ